MAKNLVNTLADLEEDEALALVAERLRAGDDPYAILADAREGVAIVGQRFAEGVYFIPDLVFSGEIMKAISEIVKPSLTGPGEDRPRLGEVVVGTVAGDIHDIGKDIVVTMLDINGFAVRDLGIDVPVERFVSEVRESQAHVVALSGFLTVAFQSMKDTIQALGDAGLRSDLKIMIGGGQVDEHVMSFTGADAYGRDALAAVSLAKEWLT